MAIMTRFKNALALSVLAVSGSPLVAAGPAFTWSNPLPFEHSEGQTAPRREIRDPCIIRESDRYYLVFTMWPFRGREEKYLAEPNAGGSPGIVLYSSPDLKAWKFESWLVKSSDLPANCPYKHRFWAPEIHKMGGKFYLVFLSARFSQV
jgi:xylan 1,4-beta-xylosidase